MKQNCLIKRVKDVCNILNGFAFKSQEYVESGIRVIRITNVQKGFIVDDDPKFYPLSSKNSLTNYLLRKDDLLMSLTGNVGRVGILSEDFLPAALNQRVACLRIDESVINKRYLFHILNSDKFERECVFNATGIAQKNMSTKWLGEYQIPVPPKDEQHRIVAELDLLTEVIDKQKTQLKELDTLAQSIFYDMFGDPIENEKGWSTNTIQSIALKYTDGPFGSNLKSEHYQESGVRIIRLQNIGVNEFVDTDKAFISEEHYKTLEKYTCYPGDIVIGTLGEPNLRACIVPQNIERAVNKADCVLCRVRKEIVSEIYLCRVLNEKKFVEAQCQLFSHGQTRARISAGQLKNTYIPIPPLTLQQSFADKIQSIENQKAKIKASIADTQKLLDYTMDKYFG